ncbi:MAG: cob(I)yrinic acid a,c-diamide adenosyltransferase [Gammaproteobacteria bacterium]|nr:cob(I)yrinic acid a,c-diamide adenosyltransferase [Gammaproteobacteria bacterium]
MTEDTYKKRMQRKKQHIDDSVEQAQIERGVIVLLTGNGKGKSSSALGMVVRALGHDMKVGVIQFIKSWTNTGEQLFLQQQENVDFHIMGTGFTWDTQDKDKDREAASVLWNKAKLMLNDSDMGMIILDEMTYMLSYRYLDAEEVITAIKNRPENQHVIITGRAASEELLELADTVSEINDVKHAFREGIKAMPGIEW